VAMTRKAGIKIAGHFIFGLPGETEETAVNTLDFAEKLDLDFVNFYSAVPFPGSSLYEEAVRKGWIRGKSWDHFHQAEFIMDLPTISTKQLYKIKKKAYYAFYFKPKRLKTIVSMVSIKSWLTRFIQTTKKMIHKSH
jgi:radical SAM superfamily enzyme YgiQ (UPF0313 family)